jgi:hypothetical protein
VAAELVGERPEGVIRLDDLVPVSKDVPGLFLRLFVAARGHHQTDVRVLQCFKLTGNLEKIGVVGQNHMSMAGESGEPGNVAFAAKSKVVEMLSTPDVQSHEGCLDRASDVLVEDEFQFDRRARSISRAAWSCSSLRS